MLKYLEKDDEFLEIYEARQKRLLDWQSAINSRERIINELDIKLNKQKNIIKKQENYIKEINKMLKTCEKAKQIKNILYELI